MSVITLGDIAQRLGGQLKGDPEQVITGLSPLGDARPGQLSFYAHKAYKKSLIATQASGVLVTPGDQSHCPVATIELADPYLGYAHASHWFEPEPALEATLIHPTAQIHPSAELGVDVRIGAYSCIGPGCRIGNRAHLGSHVILGQESVLGEGSRLFDRVTIYDHVTCGDRVRIHSGAVIGADGFGYAQDRSVSDAQPTSWVRIAQLGGVTVGDDVHIGANSTVDRGAIADTSIGRGVIIDNLVQVAHNCMIGEFTAIAGCVGISGSVKIGRWCTLAGASGVAGHVELADHVHIGMQAQVTKSILEPGYYASGTGLWPQAKWRRLVAGWRR